MGNNLRSQTYIHSISDKFYIFIKTRIALLERADFARSLLTLLLLSITYRAFLYYGLKPTLSFNSNISLRDFLTICRFDIPFCFLITLLILPINFWCKKWNKKTYTYALQHILLFILVIICTIYLVAGVSFGIGLTISMLTSSSSEFNISDALSFIPAYAWCFLLIPNTLLAVLQAIKSNRTVWISIGASLILIFYPPSSPLYSDHTMSAAILYPPVSYTICRYFQSPPSGNGNIPIKISALHFKGPAFESKTNATNPPILLTQNTTKPKHVILFIVESMRYDAPTSSTDDPNKKAMPFLNELEQKSVVFEHHYSTSNNSFPSLFSIITGLYPSAENIDFILAKNTRIPTLASFVEEERPGKVQALWLTPGSDTFFFPTALIKNGGFELIGKDQIPSYGRKDFSSVARNEFSAFDYFSLRLDQQKPSAYQTVDIYETFIGHFFYDDYGSQFRVILNPHTFHDRYLNNLYIADLLLKRLYDKINSDPFRKNNTILIVTGDHGQSFGEKGFLGHGNCPYENAIHVPCLIYAPGLLKPQKIDVPTCHADLVPTLLDLLGENDNPDLFQGNSLTRPLNRKYIFNIGYEGSLSAISCDLIKTIWFPDGRRLAFNLKLDPNEQSPLKLDLYNEQFNTMFTFAQQQTKLLVKYQNDLVKNHLTKVLTNER